MNTCNNYKGWEYRLWTNEDLNKKNFPLTYGYIQKSLKIGEELGSVTKKYAQVADLMRLEILYRHGGVYLDTTIECLNLEKLIGIKDEFIVSNEDPCGFDCVNNDDLHYISNSFVASIKGHPILKKMLSKTVLKKIDLHSKFVNYETGPFFIGENIYKLKDKYDITMLPTELIYPHGYKNKYRKRDQSDKCFRYKKNRSTNMSIKNKYDEEVYLQYPCKSYPKSYLIKHWEVGGSWK